MSLYWPLLFLHCEKCRKLQLLYLHNHSKVWDLRNVNVFERVSFAHQGCIYLIKNPIKTVKLWNNIIIIQNNTFLFEYILKYNLFLWYKAAFSASLLQSSVSHDPSEIILIYWFAAQENFLLLSMLKMNIFCVNHDFRILWWIESSKEQYLFEIEIFVTL